MCFQLAREQAEKAAADGLHTETNASSLPPTTSGTSVEQPSAAVNLASSTTSTVAGVNLSPIPVTTVGSNANTPTVIASELPAVPVIQTANSSITGVSLGETVASSHSEVPGSSGVPMKMSSTDSTPMYGALSTDLG